MHRQSRQSPGFAATLPAGTPTFAGGAGRCAGNSGREAAGRRAGTRGRPAMHGQLEIRRMIAETERERALRTAARRAMHPAPQAPRRALPGNVLRVVVWLLRVARSRGAVECEGRAGEA